MIDTTNKDDDKYRERPKLSDGQMVALKTVFANLPREQAQELLQQLQHNISELESLAQGGNSTSLSEPLSQDTVQPCAAPVELREFPSDTQVNTRKGGASVSPAPQGEIPSTLTPSNASHVEIAPVSPSETAVNTRKTAHSNIEGSSSKRSKKPKKVDGHASSKASANYADEWLPEMPDWSFNRNGKKGGMIIGWIPVNETPLKFIVSSETFGYKTVKEQNAIAQRLGGRLGTRQEREIYDRYLKQREAQGFLSEGEKCALELEQMVFLRDSSGVVTGGRYLHNDAAQGGPSPDVGAFIVIDHAKPPVIAAARTSGGVISREAQTGLQDASTTGVSIPSPQIHSWRLRDCVDDIQIESVLILDGSERRVVLSESVGNGKKGIEAFLVEVGGRVATQQECDAYFGHLTTVPLGYERHAVEDLANDILQYLGVESSASLKLVVFDATNNELTAPGANVCSDTLPDHLL